VFTGTHDELLARRAAATKLFSAQSLAHGWAGLTPASYSAPYAARQVFSDPYYISEEVDCTQSDGLNATAWNDGYGMYLGQYATIDGVEVQTFTYAEAVSIEDAPMICQVYFQDLFCGTEAEWWPAICQEAGYCCPLDA
jgi:hypothetical protein